MIPAVTPLLVMRKSYLPSTRAVLNCVARKWPDRCTMSELLAVFVQHDLPNADMTQTTEVRLDAMLRTLFNAGQLSVSGWDADRLWSLGPDVQFATPSKSGKPIKRQKSRYVPTHQPVLRSGAQDFLRFPSHGNRC